MIINKVVLHNFQLFKDQEINLGQLNLVTGLNRDSKETNGVLSGNGAGKSTILNAIVFGLFGEVSGINLIELIRIGEKECTVILECSINNEQYRIERKIIR
jgi:DNA repair exonuclease SbcCD ATPase subunit